MYDKIGIILEQRGSHFNWLAGQLGVSRSGLVSGLKTGKLGSDTLKRICLELGLSADYLLDLDQEGQKKLDPDIVLARMENDIRLLRNGLSKKS